MTKVYIAIGVIVFSFGTGWKAKGWYEDSKKVKVLNELIGTDNNNKAKLALIRTEASGATSNAKRSINEIPGLDVVFGTCPDIGIVFNEANDKHPGMFYQ